MIQADTTTNEKTNVLFDPDASQNNNKNHLSEILVLWSQLDANGHVNNGTYQFYFDEARTQALGDEGFSISAMRASSIGPVIQKADLHYMKPMSHPEVAIIETSFGDLKGFRGKVFQTIRRKSDSEKVCDAIFYALFFDFKKKRPWKLPIEFIQKYS